MKKLLLGILLLCTIGANAQRANKTYKLYYVDTAYRSLEEAGMTMRNDTLYVSLSSPVNIVLVATEDSLWKGILLRPFREVTKPKPTLQIKSKSKP